MVEQKKVHGRNTLMFKGTNMLLFLDLESLNLQVMKCSGVFCPRLRPLGFGK